MKEEILLVAALAACSGLGFGQDPQSVLFTVSSRQLVASGSGGSYSLQFVSQWAICQVEPDCAGTSAEKYAGSRSWEALLGDVDSDGTFEDSGMFGGAIDALHVRRVHGDGRVDLRRILFSPADHVETTVSGSPGLLKGSVGAVIRDAAGNDGQIELFLSAGQVRRALGLTIPRIEINVDAITQDEQGNIYLSLEDDRMMHLDDGMGGTTNVLLEDGGVVLIPASGITYDPATGNVASVGLRSAVPLLSEGATDWYVDNAGINDRLANCVTSIEDLDSLEVDRSGRGRGLTTQWAGRVYYVADLVFGGQNLTGCGLVTTVMNGQIFTINGCAMGTSCGGGATRGEQMGLLAPHATNGITAVVNGLVLPDDKPPRFLLGSPTPQRTTPATVEVHVSADPGYLAGGPFPGLAFLGLGFMSSPAVPATATSPFDPLVLCFPDYYTDVFHWDPVALDPDGFGFWSASVPLLAAPIDVICQAAYFTTGPLELSHGAILQLQ